MSPIATTAGLIKPRDDVVYWSLNEPTNHFFATVISVHDNRAIIVHRKGNTAPVPIRCHRLMVLAEKPKRDFWSPNAQG